MEEPTIYLGCPIQNRGWIIHLWLEHILNLDYPKEKIHLSFLVNYPRDNPNFKKDNTEQVLKKFKAEHEGEYKKITIRIAEGNWADSRAFGRWFSYFAELRNIWLDMRDDEDYIFSVDSDILIPPESLNKLLSREKDIVSLLICNGPIYQAGPMQGMMAYNFMMVFKKNPNSKNDYDKEDYLHFQPRWLQIQEIRYASKEWIQSHMARDCPFIYPDSYSDLPPVDMTGAAFLINRKVIDDGVIWGFHHQGEDCYFSAMAKSKGYELYCDYKLQAPHLMNPQQLHQWLGEQMENKRIKLVEKENMDEPDIEPVIEIIE